MGAAEETLDLQQAADLAKVGLECMRGYVDSGEVPAARLNQKHVVLLREDVLDFIRVLARKQAEERRKSRAKPERRGRVKAPSLEQYGT